MSEDNEEQEPTIEQRLDRLEKAMTGCVEIIKTSGTATEQLNKILEAHEKRLELVHEKRQAKADKAKEDDKSDSEYWQKYKKINEESRLESAKIAKELQDEAMRKQCWIETYAAVAGAAGDHKGAACERWANQALERYDKTFGKEEGS